MSKRQENRGSFENRLKGQKCTSELFSAAAAARQTLYNLAKFLAKPMALKPGRKIPSGWSFVCLFVWLMPTQANTHLSLSLPPSCAQSGAVCVGKPFGNPAPSLPAAPRSPWQSLKQMDHWAPPQGEEFGCLQLEGGQGRGRVTAVVSC